MTLTSTTSHPVAGVGAPTARDYFRVSKDASGRLRSATEQEADNRTQWGVELSFNGESYAEADAVSASRFTSKNRGGFGRLMTDLRTRRFGADVLVLWEPSRGSRKVGEWCSLIDLCQEAGVRIAVTTHGRIYDPGNARDRRTLQEDAVDAEYESGKISDRVLRAMSANAADGKPHARTPFGYRRIYDERTGRLLRQEPDPDTAPLVRELFDRLQRGDSLKAVARDWSARGVVNGQGEPYTSQHLRAIATRKAYGGQRVHKGKLTAAAWPALVPAPTFHAVQRMFDERRGTSPRSGRARHLLTGIAVCDVCSGPLSAEWRHGIPCYRCRHRRCVAIDKAGLDALAEKVIVAYLSRKHRAEKLTADDGADVELDAARAEVAKIRGELDDWRGKARRREVSAASFAEIEPGILEDLGKAEAREADLSTPSRLRGLIKPGEDVAKRWRDAPLSAQREIARIVCTPDLVGELRVGRATTPGEIEDRVTWRRS